MLKDKHVFKTDSNFSDAVSLYSFDKELRLFLFNEIEDIEVAVRSAVANITAQMLSDRFWLTEQSSYANEGLFRKKMSLIDTE